MQDEILKHTKKAFAVMSNSETSFGHKVKEVLLEIGIIVFAVSLSIWLHGWSEHRHQQAEAKAFLVDLKEDIKRDIENITTSKNRTAKNLKINLFMLSLTKARIDSLKKADASVSYKFEFSQTKLNNGTYEGFKSSGKIGSIEDKDLKKSILGYYQVTTPSLVEVEKLAANVDDKALSYVIDNPEKELVSYPKKESDKIIDPKFKNYLKLSTDYSQAMVNNYTEILKEANKLLAEIDKYNQ
ncbi:DUF6090 family protein [Spirosoma montaniterrae]|nr:DUF6090 family protein [Spirosoma montaniterrae]